MIFVVAFMGAWGAIAGALLGQAMFNRPLVGALIGWLLGLVSVVMGFFLRWAHV